MLRKVQAEAQGQSKSVLVDVPHPKGGCVAASEVTLGHCSGHARKYSVTTGAGRSQQEDPSPQGKDVMCKLNLGDCDTVVWVRVLVHFLVAPWLGFPITTTSSKCTVNFWLHCAICVTLRNAD